MFASQGRLLLAHPSVPGPSGLLEGMLSECSVGPEHSTAPHRDHSDLEGKSSELCPCLSWEVAGSWGSDTGSRRTGNPAFATDLSSTLCSNNAVTESNLPEVNDGHTGRQPEGLHA